MLQVGQDDTNPREAIVQGMVASGYAIVSQQVSLFDAIKHTHHYHYIFQAKEGKKAHHFVFLEDKFKFAYVNDYDYLFAKRAVRVLKDGDFTRVKFSEESISSCCTGSSFKCYDSFTGKAYHVSTVVGHPPTADQISIDKLGFSIE